MTITFPPPLKNRSTIGITAPSNSVPKAFQPLLDLAILNFKKRGFKIIEGKTVRRETRADKTTRASELEDFLLNDQIDAIFPPWGGNLLIDILPLLSWDKLKNINKKWIIGYSDISTLNFVYTLLTGTATAHSTNLIDLSAKNWDNVTSKWLNILETDSGIFTQISSKYCQSSWEKSHKPLGSGFYLDTPTFWRLFGENKEAKSTEFSGILLGGCLNTLKTLIGTHFGNITKFRQNFIGDSPLIWYLESTNVNIYDIYDSLWQMKHSGWFNNTSGILFGRFYNCQVEKDLNIESTIHSVLSDLNLPILYNVDIGHSPPQMTLINGANATVTYHDGLGEIKTFIPRRVG
ncbi:LD-carboxypeptidase [Bacillus aquiflavi]|uniref:S66 family peptidase n=1 Tax=Bacillus aquiflavi TaxID=2672567 RepID=UPI001CA8AFAF|nr:S66 peptidase family protein [Bacillus aquiflavi]UAC48075.1 LD-carboxypeptidase [Bacillus aquiflavi]